MKMQSHAGLGTQYLCVCLHPLLAHGVQVVRSDFVEGDPTMTKIKLNKFKKILGAKRDDLEHILCKREGIAMEKSADALDQVRDAADLEVVLRTLDQESILLPHVRSALRRIEERSFGICVNCEDEITLQRLTAVPWTPLCIHCQKQAERRGQTGNAEIRLRAA
jgi:DnaK suppressor protein